MEIWVDPKANLLRTGTNVAFGHHRWEATLLASLIRLEGDPLDLGGGLVSVLHHHGQLKPLDRTGVRRLLMGLESMLNELLGQGAFAARVQWPPRGRTVGPWRFNPGPEEAWLVVDDDQSEFHGSRAKLCNPMLGSASPPALAGADNCSVSVRAIELLVRSDALTRSGRLVEALDLLTAFSHLVGITPELRGIGDLRRARILKRQGRYDESAEAAAQVLAASRAKECRDTSQRWLAELHLLRQTYDRDPSQFESINQGVALAPLSAMPDLRGLGELMNLRAAVLRRRGLRLLAASRKAESEDALNAAWKLQCVAMYWAVSLRDHESCQYYAFNMGLIQQSLFSAGHPDRIVDAVRCHALALLISDEFGVGNDSVWDGITLSSLWLDHPDKRAEFAAALGYGSSPPTQLAFYDDLAKAARRIGEPRQIAIALVNMWRFGEDSASGADGRAIRRRAKAELEQLLRGCDELRDTLLHDAPETMGRILAR